MKRVRDQLSARCANLVEEIAAARSEFARRLLGERLTQLEPDVEKANEQIAQYEALLHDQETRRLFIADLDLEVLRYNARLRRLDIANPDDVRSLHTILVSLGTAVKVGRREDGLLGVDVDLNLRRGIATAWFPHSTPEEIRADIDAAWPGAAPESIQI